jgi:hypothetical protein
MYCAEVSTGSVEATGSWNIRKNIYGMLARSSGVSFHPGLAVPTDACVEQICCLLCFIAPLWGGGMMHFQGSQVFCRTVPNYT